MSHSTRRGMGITNARVRRRYIWLSGGTMPRPSPHSIPAVCWGWERNRVTWQTHVTGCLCLAGACHAAAVVLCMCWCPTLPAVLGARAHSVRTDNLPVWQRECRGMFWVTAAAPWTVDSVALDHFHGWCGFAACGWWLNRRVVPVPAYSNRDFPLAGVPSCLPAAVMLCSADVCTHALWCASAWRPSLCTCAPKICAQASGVARPLRFTHQQRRQAEHI
jgi:hypothetical protein